MSDTTTAYEAKCDILAEVWVEHRNDIMLQDFVEYNDLGLPLAYAISNGIVASTDLAKSFIEETFDVMLDTVFSVEDTGFNSLLDLFMASDIKDIG